MSLVGNELYPVGCNIEPVLASLVRTSSQAGCEELYTEFVTFHVAFTLRGDPYY